MSLRVLKDRDDVVLDAEDGLTLQSLLAVGTSAGGRQMKAVLAINEATGEIRSGQTDGLEGFEYCILKFGDSAMPLAEIETAYSRMALAAGIEMEECRLFPVDGICHFLTRRFDRKNGRKVHIQTLAAINPEARSYEDLVRTCRALSISESEIEQMYARMVFNVMANNTDDHNKNFSFLLDDAGRWHPAPAYDITFIFNANGTGPNTERRLSIGGKTAGIVKSDLIDFARQNDIKRAGTMIDRVADAVRRFGEFADICCISGPWRGIIQKALNDCLATFGYMDSADDTENVLHDGAGRTVRDVSISVNSKGYYEVSAIIDGKRRRRFLKPGKPLYDELSRQDIISLGPSEKIGLVEALFTDSSSLT